VIDQFCDYQKEQERHTFYISLKFRNVDETLGKGLFMAINGTIYMSHVRRQCPPEVRFPSCYVRHRNITFIVMIVSQRQETPRQFFST